MLHFNHLVSMLFLFVITVLMVTFSWIGLADFKWYSYDGLAHLSKKITTAELDPNLLLAVKVLQNTDTVESRYVGAGGKISKNYTAFNTILGHKYADLAFEFLLGTNNITAQVYAIHGFEQINKSRFNELQPIFINNNQTIHLQSGCSGFLQPVSGFFDMPEAKRLGYFNIQQ